MTISAIIVDDELLARERLRSLLGEHADIEITSEFATADAAREFLDLHTPDIVLLDVQLGDRSGFSIANMARNADLPFVIFTTAFGIRGESIRGARGRLHREADRAVAPERSARQGPEAASPAGR